MRLLFCGDIMTGGVLPYQNEFLSNATKEYLHSFDLVIGTLETAIGTNLPFDEVKMSGRCNIIYSRNEDFFRVKEMNVGVVSLANNHVCDLGVDGLKNTIDILKKNNIKFCGAGMNIYEAAEPLILNVGNQKIAILAYCSSDPNQMGHVTVATENSYGVNPFDISKACEEVKKYKASCDKVVVMVHWGKEYQVFPLTQIKHESYQLADSGADFIIGAHTHSVQPYIRHKHCHIFYGLGNFVFPDFYMTPPRPLYYPKKEEIKAIKTTYFYPFPITEPAKRVWLKMSRFGMTAELDIRDKVKVGYKLLILDRDNILRPYSSIALTLKLWLIGNLIKMPFYNGDRLIEITKKLKRTKNTILRYLAK